MSDKARTAEQRRLRKAVGDDALKLMAAMSGILNESVFPLQQQHGEQLRALAAKIETLEGMVRALAKREPATPAEHIARAREMVGLPPGHGPSAFAADGQQRVGAEVV